MFREYSFAGCGMFWNFHWLNVKRSGNVRSTWDVLGIFTKRGMFRGYSLCGLFWKYSLNLTFFNERSDDDSSDEENGSEPLKQYGMFWEYSQNMEFSGNAQSLNVERSENIKWVNVECSGNIRYQGRCEMFFDCSLNVECAENIR